jgi:hypothetical protein
MSLARHEQVGGQVRRGEPVRAAVIGDPEPKKMTEIMA